VHDLLQALEAQQDLHNSKTVTAAALAAAGSRAAAAAYQLRFLKALASSWQKMMETASV
jgi:hypothetical protein